MPSCHQLVSKESPFGRRRLSALHVTCDYPDVVDHLKTPVIRTLVKLLSNRFDQNVFSLNRRTPSWHTFALSTVRRLGRREVALEEAPFADGTAFIYRAPPKGLFHASILRELGTRLSERVDKRDLPDIIVGHKLSVEGIAVHAMARHLRRPYAICIQGDTDTKIIAARPDLVPTLRRVFHEASVVFPFTPWALEAVSERLGQRSGKTVMLPCPTDLDDPLPPVAGGNGFLTAFHLKNYRRKNFRVMAQSMRHLASIRPDLKLDVAGGGNQMDHDACLKIAISIPAISFLGPLDHAALRHRFNAATGFVLPSMRESFGLVFIEALFSGLPIIYPQGTAISGYFHNAPFAIEVDAKDPLAIANAMIRLANNEAQIKHALAAWQVSPEADHFRRPAISRNFANGLLAGSSVTLE